MKGNNNQTIREIIKRLMSNPKLSERLVNLDAIDAWKEIIGVSLLKYIIDQRIHKGVLYVNLKSGVLRNELSYKKSDLIKQINSKIGKELIKDIILK